MNQIPTQKTLNKAVNFLTPHKTFYYQQGDDKMDTTVSDTKQQTKPYSTPRSKTSMSEFYENSIQTPVKKAKRRECTPDSPGGSEKKPFEQPEEVEYSFMMSAKKMSKSKFMESIEKVNTTNNNSFGAYFKESEEILNKIKGSYLLDLIEGNHNSVTFFQNVINDGQLFNQITMLICFTFFEGFNTRSDLFFKFIVNLLILDLIDYFRNRRSASWLF
jgi:hypothetical protein